MFITKKVHGDISRLNFNAFVIVQDVFFRMKPLETFLSTIIRTL